MCRLLSPVIPAFVRAFLICSSQTHSEENCCCDDSGRRDERVLIWDRKHQACISGPYHYKLASFLQSNLNCEVYINQVSRIPFCSYFCLDTQHVYHRYGSVNVPIKYIHSNANAHRTCSFFLLTIPKWLFVKSFKYVSLTCMHAQLSCNRVQGS